MAPRTLTTLTLTPTLTLTLTLTLTPTLIKGISLEPSSNAAGYRGVKVSTRSKSRPFQANVKRGGKNVYLGNFATAEEAALSREI